MSTVNDVLSEDEVEYRRHVKRVVAESPPLAQWQIDRLAAIIRDPRSYRQPANAGRRLATENEQP